MSASIRISDFAGCYGTNGFVVLLPDTDSAAARPVVEKIQALISAIQIPDFDHAITASAAIAVFPEHVLDSESLERALDQSVRKARAAGGDRIEEFSEPAVRAPLVVQWDQEERGTHFRLARWANPGSGDYPGPILRCSDQVITDRLSMIKNRARRLEIRAYGV